MTKNLSKILLLTIFIIFMTKNICYAGWKPENHNKYIIKEMVKIIKKEDIKRIAVSGHIAPDGDSFGSSFAFAILLKEVTKNPIDLYIFGKLPKRYEFLKEDLKNINIIEITENSNLKTTKKYNLAVSLDTASENRFFKNYYKDIFEKADYTFKIDHHQYFSYVKNNKIIDNNFADFNLIDQTSPSASLLTMQFVKPLGLRPQKLPINYNNAVFTGLLTDTGGFKFINNSKPYKDAYLLIENGVNNRQIQHLVFGNTAPCVLKVKQVTEKNIKYANNGKIAYIVQNEEIKTAIKEASKQGYQPEAIETIEAIASSLPDIKGVEVGFTVSEKNNKTAFSLRSLKVDISKIAEKHGGGGHKNAAGFSTDLKNEQLKELINQVIKEFSEIIN